MTDRNALISTCPPSHPHANAFWRAHCFSLFNQSGHHVSTSSWKRLMLKSQSEFYLLTSCLWNIQRHLKLVITSRIYTYLKNTWIISCLFLWLRQTRRVAASYSCHYHSTFLFYCPSNMYRFNDLERDQWNSSQHCMFINEPPVHCDVLVSGLCQWYCRRQLRVSLFLIKRKLATDK